MGRYSADSDQHTVGFHATDDDLVSRLSECVADGLAVGDSVVVLATADHCAQLAAELGADLDLDRYVAEGRYRDLDADSTLDAIRFAQGIDPIAFERLVGAVVATAAAGGRRVRVVGEIVGLMWDGGDVVGAVELEALFNDLLRRTGLVLNCAYPAEHGSDDLGSLCVICACHSAVDLSAELLAGDGPQADGSVTRLYVPHRGAAVQARRQVERTLRDWECDEAMIGDAVLLASEIATNAVVHARTPFRLTVSRGPGTVRIAVTDGGETMPVRRNPAPDEPGGRGMALVEMLTVASGADAVDGGKVVWAELAA